MRLGWALLLGTICGIAVAWWLSREKPEQARAKTERAETAAAANAKDARPVLYRWRDDADTLHVTQQPPVGRRYEIVDAQPSAGIEVDGSRR